MTGTGSGRAVHTVLQADVRTTSRKQSIRERAEGRPGIAVRLERQEGVLRSNRSAHGEKWVQRSLPCRPPHRLHPHTGQPAA